jgi:hypothetical protein
LLDFSVIFFLVFGWKSVQMWFMVVILRQINLQALFVEHGLPIVDKCVDYSLFAILVVFQVPVSFVLLLPSWTALGDCPTNHDCWNEIVAK